MCNQNSSAATQAFLQALRAGDESVIAPFYQYIRKHIFKHYRNQCSEFQLQQLEECFNIGFLKFLDKIRPPQFYSHNPAGLAFTMIKGCFRNQLRLQRKTINLEAIPEPKALDTFKKQYNYAHQFFEEQLEAKAKNWYEQLSRRDKDIFDLYLQGHSQKEIAQILGLHYGSLRNIFGRLLKEIQRIIQ